MATCHAKRGDGIAWDTKTHRLHLCVWAIRKLLLAEPRLPQVIRDELPTENGTAKLVLMAYRNAVDDCGFKVDEVSICFEDHGKDGAK